MLFLCGYPIAVFSWHIGFGPFRNSLKYKRNANDFILSRRLASPYFPRVISPIASWSGFLRAYVNPFLFTSSVDSDFAKLVPCGACDCFRRCSRMMSFSWVSSSAFFLCSLMIPLTSLPGIFENMLGFLSFLLLFWISSIRNSSIARGHLFQHPEIGHFGG